MINENYEAQRAIQKEYPNAIIINVAASSVPGKQDLIRRLNALSSQRFGQFNVKTKFANADEIKKYTTRPKDSQKPVILFIMAESKKITAEQKLRKIIREEILKEENTSIDNKTLKEVLWNRGLGSYYKASDEIRKLLYAYSSVSSLPSDVTVQDLDDLSKLLSKLAADLVSAKNAIKQ